MASSKYFIGFGRTNLFWLRHRQQLDLKSYYQNQIYLLISIYIFYLMYCIISKSFSSSSILLFNSSYFFLSSELFQNFTIVLNKAYPPVTNAEIMKILKSVKSVRFCKISASSTNCILYYVWIFQMYWIIENISELLSTISNK